MVVIKVLTARNLGKSHTQKPSYIINARTCFLGQRSYQLCYCLLLGKPNLSVGLTPLCETDPSQCVPEPHGGQSQSTHQLFRAICLTG